MSGLIRRSDIADLRASVPIEEVISEHVTLKRAGMNALKGLCPFHDEKTPSFTVMTANNRWRCYGCGENGDVISFMQRINQMDFVEAVEALAARYGITLTYEDGGGHDRQDFGSRQRLYDINAITENYYREQLRTPQAEIGRVFLEQRGFSLDTAEYFGVGFAPEGWDNLLKHIRGRGFTDAEIEAAGVVSRGQRGIYDRFRGRLIWPIRDNTGKAIGFGARKLLESDQGPKYLNTPETDVYKKSQVLYGLDLARREIASKHQVVVMEGYTDVMAAHVAGIKTAVASCGTAFGADHIKIVRRIMGDSSKSSGLSLSAEMKALGSEVIFTFDGDAAGQKAALRAFEEDDRFLAQTYVAVEPNGLDPCDLRLQRGDAALQELIANKRPLYEFAIRSALKQLNLDTVEGQVAGLRIAAPVVAAIRDQAMRPEYARRLSGWLGMDEKVVLKAVSDAQRSRAKIDFGEANQIDSRTGFEQNRSATLTPFDNAEHTHVDQHALEEPVLRLRDVVQPRDKNAQIEANVLAMMFQYPSYLDKYLVEYLPDDSFQVPALQGVWDVIVASTMLTEVIDGHYQLSSFIDDCLEIADDATKPLISELTTMQIQLSSLDKLRDYGSSLLTGLVDLSLKRRFTALTSRLKRTDSSDTDEVNRIMAELGEIKRRQQQLRDF